MQIFQVSQVKQEKSNKRWVGKHSEKYEIQIKIIRVLERESCVIILIYYDNGGNSARENWICTAYT